jgi:hypothetical protein
MMALRPRLAWLVWAWFALSAALSLFESVSAFPGVVSADSLATLVQILASIAFPIMFVLVGALIVSRQPRNLIGWLLLVPSLSDILSVSAAAYLQVAAVESPGANFLILAALWFRNWDWWGLIGPSLMIFLLFPTGRLLSPSWRWVVVALALVFAYFVIVIALQTHLSDPETHLSRANPIGVISDPLEDSEAFPAVLLPFLLGLVACAALSVASLVVRYRRAGPVERAQIKWLLYPGVVLAALYALNVAIRALNSDWFGVIFSLTLSAIPAAIAIAILRYRLWDIDVVIRRTLIYSILTGLLALTYFGAVLVLQNVFRVLTGQEQNSLAAVLSTLAIAALFGPLRSRVQRAIDRRFFRSKYDAARALGGFAASARDETNLESLSAQLVRVVDDTMQPEIVSLWLRPGAGGPTGPPANGRGGTV